MARTKIKHRSYKNAANPQLESSPEPENLRVEVPDPVSTQEIPDSTAPEEDCLPMPLIRPASVAERPPDPLPEDEEPPSPSSPASPENESVSYAPATSTSAPYDVNTFPVDYISPGSPVNLSRHSPTPGCSRDSTPRLPEPQPSTSYHQPSTSHHRPSISYQDRDTPSPQPSTSYACDVPSTSYHRPRSPTEPVPGCSRDYYPRPGTSSMLDHTYNSSPSSPVNLSWNSPIPGCSRDSAFQPRPSTSRDISRMSPSPPLGMTIWDSMKENCQQRANAAANFRPRTPDMDALPVDEIFSPNTQRDIRSSIQNLFPNGPPPLPLIKPVRRPKKSDIPYIVGCNKRPRVPSPSRLTVFQGDKYGITSQTNLDEDEEPAPSKRGRRNPGIPGYSHSRFNAQSDDIASRLKLHEKIDSLLGRGSEPQDEPQDEPLGYVIKKVIPPRKFSPLPSTSTDSETIMKNDKHFSESFGREMDLDDDDDDDELPEIVWGSRSQNVSPIDENDNTNIDSQTDDSNALVINEDANDNNDIEYNYNEIQFDKYIPKEKLVESSDVVIVDPRPEGEPRIVETIDLKDGYVFRSPKPVTPTPTGEVICVPDANETSNAGNQNDANGNVIELPNGPVLRSSKKKPNATETQSDVIEVPDTEVNNTAQSSGSTVSYPGVEFVSETRSETSNSETPTQNILDVQIITCDGENGANSRPRSNDLLNELQSWFSMLSDSCERRLSGPRCRSRSKRNSPNRENRAPPALNNNVSTPTPETSSQPAPTAEPARQPSNGKKLGNCPICLDSLSASLLASTNCGHVFCLECIKKSLSTSGKKCPTCRKQLKGVGYHQVFL